MAWGRGGATRSAIRTISGETTSQVLEIGPSAGNGTSFGGFPAAFHSWVAAIIVAMLMVLAYGWRISAEERMLAEHFGDEYRNYAARTARLIPGIF